MGVRKEQTKIKSTFFWFVRRLAKVLSKKKEQGPGSFADSLGDHLTCVNQQIKGDALVPSGSDEATGITEAGIISKNFEKSSPYQQRTPPIILLSDYKSFQQGQILNRKFLGGDISDKPTLDQAMVDKFRERLEGELEYYQRREITDDVEFLFLDGMVMIFPKKSARQVWLCAYGICANGRKELLGFQQTVYEDCTSWRKIIMDLKSRGMRGRRLKLITIDGNFALLRAVKELFPAIKRQRCIKNKWRNVKNKLKVHQQKPCLSDLGRLLKAHSREEMLANFNVWRSKWENEAERAVNCLEKSLNEITAYLDFEESLWPELRTTATIERALRELRLKCKIRQLLYNNRDMNSLPLWIANIIAHNMEKEFEEEGRHKIS